MKSTHQVHFGDARDLSGIPDESVQLVCTSPPYPLIQMWDAQFAQLDPVIGDLLESGEAWEAWERMHQQLDCVYRECFRVLQSGCIAVINMGDATRTVAGDFQLFPNHSRVLQGMRQAGFTPLPDILWRKPTNSPNKFMGSGMLPAGAYVTYEHEYILVFRKGSKRSFSTAAQKLNRRESAFFWEERNRWFSDVWQDVSGAGQELIAPEARSRSAAFPVRIPWRLIQMFSVYGDTVLDPFLGTGTTLAAAAGSARNSIGVELVDGLLPGMDSMVRQGAKMGAVWSQKRIEHHVRFLQQRESVEKPVRHFNEGFGLPVMTKQESAMRFYGASTVIQSDPLNWVVKHTAFETQNEQEVSHG